MKKLIPLLTAALLAAALSYAAPDPEANRQIDRLKARSAVLETEMAAVEAVAAAALPVASLAVVNTNTTADSTLTTPAFVGQLLIGTVSNVVWAAEGLTTNSWIKISN